MWSQAKAVYLGQSSHLVPLPVSVPHRSRGTEGREMISAGSWQSQPPLSPDDCSVAGDPVVSCMLLPYLHLTLVFSPQESSLPCCCGSTLGKPLRNRSPQVSQVRPSPHRQEVLWGSSVWRSPEGNSGPRPSTQQQPEQF